MLPTIRPPGANLVVDPSSTGCVAARGGWHEALTRLDEVLFQPGQFFTVDAGNRRVAPVWPASAAAGLQLVDHGGIAAVVGQLREHVRVVDLNDPVATRVRQALTAWARAQGLAALVRPSGRPGHVHVFMVGAGLEVDALEQECARLRTVHGVPHAAIHARTKIRTLTSPHKQGLPCPLPLTEADAQGSDAEQGLLCSLPLTDLFPARGGDPGWGTWSKVLVSCFCPCGNTLGAGEALVDS